MAKKYSVNEAVWIATALMTWEKYLKLENPKKEDMYFKQADIIRRAQTLTDKKVDAARVSWWTNADNEKSSCNYLRGNLVSDLSLRRLSMINEFSEKSYPEDLDIEDEVVGANGIATIGELVDFIVNEYSKIVLDNKFEIEEINKSKRGWLLTWNPEYWAWNDYEKWCDGTKKGEKYTIAWTCNSKQPKVGDEVFLMKLGAEPRGIIAHGCVVKESYAETHYNELKAAEGKTLDTIDVEFDRIQDYEKNEMFLLQYELKQEFPEQQWSPIGSGIEIRKSVFYKVKDKWNEVLDDKYWPSLDEYSTGLTKEDWKRYLREIEIPNHPSPMKMLVGMLKLGGMASCKKLAEIYGNTPQSYVGSINAFAKRSKIYFGISGCMDKSGERNFTIPFQRMCVYEEKGDIYIFKMRKELYDALNEIDLSVFNPHDDNSDNVGKGKNMRIIDFPKNMILYGPPGTGKTYNSAIYTVAICDGEDIKSVKTRDYNEVMARYRELVAENRVAFTTFHQSYGYEEFIEGIKPVIDDENNGIGYTIEDGVFKAFCNNSRIITHGMIDPNVNVWKVVIRVGGNVGINTIKTHCWHMGKILFDWKTQEEHVGTYDYNLITHFRDRINIGDIVVTYAGNGTDIDSIGRITGDAVYDNNNQSYRWSRSVEWLETNRVRNIKALNGNKFMSNDKLQHLKRIDTTELLKLVKPQDYKSDDNKYVFIIDEINRGNISKIFGELITLIEDTKRAGQKEEMSATLPYSGDKFSVPSNVYILGTMNTADRSIALMDTALRRRFQFVEMMPDVNVLREIGADKVEDLDVAEMLEKINERIEFLYDREHTIGHAFFTKLKDNPTIETLKAIFEGSVIPLLQEYFYEDYEKIQLVLGDNAKEDESLKFIVDRSVKIKDVFKGNVSGAFDLNEKKYYINHEAFSNLESYKGIL